MVEVQCQVAHVTIEMEEHKLEISVPAFTRSTDDLRAVALEAVEFYLSVSNMNGEGKSLADLGMYMLAKASLEPLVQEKGSDCE